ncbi:DEAD/DEAH box helicase [Glaciibacter flavus]|uniref:DEAD/DEAH box helicase n=1 Tax=Orlajensenia flava TaxID=2565934 RepID=A0A4S4FVF2_9MICO|nr:DEAD/DEAH box helicase [Glaciibacter flavus]THG34341.1 DEAD/DEAH box helicase [Glaciibacter flavus]
MFDAQFEGLRRIGEITVSRPSDQLEIDFEPGLLVLDLALTMTDGELCLGLASADSHSAPIVEWPTVDHVVIEATWWAIDEPTLREVRAALEGESIQLGVPLAMNQLLWLVWHDYVDVDASVLSQISGNSNVSSRTREFDAGLLSATLYPYQVSGATYLTSIVEQGLGALLADEMGLGKTMQALYVVSQLARASKSTALIVVPASTLANWEREFAKFARDLTVTSHVGSRRTGDHRALSRFNVVLTTYETATRDQTMLQMIDWSVVILDEAQSIKNRDSRRSAAVKQLRTQAAIAITGTPIENSLTDLWSIFEFLAPDHLGSLTEFQSRFPDNEMAAEQLSRRVAPLVIRRSVASVATDLPERVDIVTPIYVDAQIARSYEDARTTGHTAPLALLTKLRQICAGSAGADDDLLVASPKFARLREILEGLGSDGSKALIFSSFIDSIDALAHSVRELFPNMFVATVDGRSSPAERQAIIDDFSAHVGASVLVLNPRAAGVGLNIQAANYVIHFTPEWNPAIVAQASARSHRRGQHKPVFVYYLYYVDTVEDVMMSRLDIKRRLQTAGLSSASDEPGQSDLIAALAISPSGSFH